MPTPAEEAFARHVDELLAEVGNLTEEGVRRAAELVEEIRRDIASRLATLDPDSVTAAHLSSLRKQLRAAIAELAERYQVELASLISDAAELGASILGAGSGVSSTLLEVLQGYSAELVDGLSDYARKRIDLVISQTTLGSLTPYQATRRIAGELPARSVFRSLSSRAETILRTEVNRAFSVATQARMKEASETAPALKKRWVTAGDTRVRATHLAVGGSVVGANERFSVGTYTAAYPRDPALPAKETVNCRCHVVPVVDEEVLAALGEGGGDN